MIEYKQNLEGRLPVRLFDSLGAPVTGVVFGDVTATLEYSTGAFTTLTMTSPMWSESATDAFAGTGTYDLIVPLVNMNITGVLSYAVKVTGAVTYINTVKIVEVEEADTYNRVIRLLTVSEGRWKIYDSGPDANRLVLFQEDGVTQFQSWDLKDIAGAPTTTDVFERVPTTPFPGF